MRDIDVVKASRGGDCFQGLRSTGTGLYKHTVDRVVDHAIAMDVRTDAIVIRDKQTSSLALGIPEIVFAETVRRCADCRIGAACDKAVCNRWTRVDDIDRGDDL